MWRSTVQINMIFTINMSVDGDTGRYHWDIVHDDKLWSRGDKKTLGKALKKIKQQIKQIEKLN